VVDQVASNQEAGMMCCESSDLLYTCSS